MKRNILASVIATAAIAAAAPTAEAASVSFASNGSTLTLTVTSLPAFSITGTGSTYQFALIIENAYSVTPSTVASGYNFDPLEVIVNGTTTWTSTFNFLYAGEETPGNSNKALLLFIMPEVTGSFSEGDTVKISDFSLVFDNQNYGTNYTLPDNPNGVSLYLVENGDFNIISNVESIPEPGAALLSALGALYFLRRRR